jgi:uroporphyrinogen decarboxylase
MVLSSRERVLCALEHKKPDRVPADMWAEPPVWVRLAEDLGLPDEDAVREHFGIDVRYISPRYPAETVSDGVMQNMWGERWKKAESVYGCEWEHVDGALSQAAAFEELEAFPWPNCDEVDYSVIPSQIKKYDGYAVFFGNADFFERPSLVRGIENFLADTLVNEDWVEFLQEKFVSFFIEDFYRTMEAAGGRIDVYWALTDLGTQDRLIMGRETMKRLIFKPLKRLADTVHREGVEMMFHSCGAVREAIPDLIRSGIDILNPLQPAAKGMEPAGLKRDFGSELCFHGGIDVQYLLPLSPPSEVRSGVSRVSKILGNDGGYILSPSHNIQLDTSTENIAAMYDTALRSV